MLKLAGGITSENVRLLRSPEEAEYWIRSLFGAGVLGLERPSLRRPRALLKRGVSALRLLTTGHPGRALLRSDVQRGYFMVQEFLEGNDFDVRVVIIGNRAYAYRRFNRPNDFRASGSGLRDPNPGRIDPAVIRLAFLVAHALGTQSLAVDGLQRRGEFVLTEISYYYEGWILHEECPGHWELSGAPDSGVLNWVDGPMRPEDAILTDFLSQIDRAGHAAGRWH